jgi:S1-C subfamily serine protease
VLLRAPDASAMKEEAPRRRPLAAALLLGVLAAGFAAGVYALRPSTPAPPAPPPEHPALTGRDIALRSFASVVSIAMKGPGGRPLSLGSGFVVERGIVVTNFHVVRGAGSGAVRLVGDSDWHAIEGVVADDDDLDLVLLSVPSLEAAPLPIGDNEKVAIGDEIFVVSNPQDLEGTFTTGIVSGKRKLDGTRLLQISAPISGGSSGGPVLDREAHVVGVATSSLRDGQNLNFAITADHLRSLVAAKGPPQELTKVTRPKRVQVARAATPEPTFFGRLRRMFGLR